MSQRVRSWSRFPTEFGVSSEYSRRAGRLAEPTGLPAVAPVYLDYGVRKGRAPHPPPRFHSGVGKGGHNLAKNGSFGIYFLISHINPAAGPQYLGI